MKYNAKSSCLLILIIMIPLLFNLKTFAESDFDIELTKANQYIDQNEFNKAEEIINKLTPLDPENLKLLKTTILLSYYEEKLDDALKTITHVKETNKNIENKPEILEFLYLESLILFEQNQKQKAMEVLDSIFKINPKHKPSFTIYCSILAETNKLNEAKDCLKQLNKMD